LAIIQSADCAEAQLFFQEVSVCFVVNNIMCLVLV